MALVRVTVLDLLEIDENGNINIRVASHIEENGIRVSAPQYHRAVYPLGVELPLTIEVPLVGTFNLGAAVLARAQQADVVARLAALAQQLAQ